MDRHPAVAGQFYPGRPEVLKKALQELLPANVVPEKALAVMVPHAGYVYSGGIAAETFARVRVPSRVIVIGPNHHGTGLPAAVFPAGNWLTPLGPVAVAADLASLLLHECPGLQADESAHRYEHSLEVQVPFIQSLNSSASIVPICLGHLGLDELLAMGRSVGQALLRLGEEVLLVASSDMTHYESGDLAREKDRLALDRVLSRDPEGLYRTVCAHRISMCGFMPTVMMLAAAAELGATSARLVRYGNSGDVTGDQSAVVGYAGVIIV